MLVSLHGLKVIYLNDRLTLRHALFQIVPEHLFFIKNINQDCIGFYNYNHHPSSELLCQKRKQLLF